MTELAQKITGLGRVVEKEKPKTARQPFAIRMLRLSLKERLFFFDQLATLIASGVTLIDSLSIIKAQTTGKTLKRLYADLIHHINGGLGLADSMYLYPHIFPHMQTALVEAGEKSGNLHRVLEQIVTEMETQQDFYRKITGAMFYPVVLIGLAMLLVAGMMTFVIPKVAHMYDQSHVALPVITQKVIDFSTFVSRHWKELLIGIVGSIFVIWTLVSRTRFFRLFWEKLVHLIPFFGGIAQEKNIMMIAANLGMLLQSGVLISESFEITENTIDNLHYKRALGDIRHGIVLGRNVSEMMGLQDLKTEKINHNGLFPIQVAQLIHIGETTGKIDQMLFKIRDNYHKSIDYKLKNISVMIEPLMIFVVAGIVGFILLAVMMPFFYIGSTIH